MKPSRVDLVRSLVSAEIRDGTLRPGAPVVVKELAAGLGISGTPVREALDRLVGEGLVVVHDRHGFAVARLSARMLAGYYELAALLGMAAAHKAGLPRYAHLPPTDDAHPSDPVAAVERLLLPRELRAAEPALTREGDRVNALLAPFRRVEPGVLPGFSQDLERLAEACRTPAFEGELGRFTRLRQERAADIVEAAEAGGGSL